MSYLARLKQLDNEERFHHTPKPEPTKPTEPPFEGFVGSIPAANENISWCWWLAFSESEHLITYHHPPTTRAKILEKYPNVLAAEPYEPPRQPVDAGLLATVDLEWEMT